MKKHAKSIGIVCVWIALWAAAAWAIGSPVILASPYETVIALGASLADPSFWAAIAGTFWHIAVGLVAACALGCLMGIVAARWQAFEAFVSPAMQFIKSAPIVCFIVLMLVWFGSAYIDLAAVLLAVLPVYYFSLSEACRQRDGKRLEMLQVFRVPFRLRLRIFEWPSVRPFFTQSTKVAVGMAWKSGVTAELIGLSFASIGERIYMSKLGLDTAGLLMWTIVIVLLSWACEKLALAALGRIGAHAPKSSEEMLPQGASECVGGPGQTVGKGNAVGIQMSSVSKSFAGNMVLDGFSCNCPAGSRTCVMGPTGTGKTTLLSLALGVVLPDEGHVDFSGAEGMETGKEGRKDSHTRSEAQLLPHMSAVFQDERLLPELSAWQNVALVAPTSQENARRLLVDLLDEDACDRKPSELSGGMKRCVEICRALAAPSGFVLMDEPFAGLDTEKKQQAIDVIDRELHGRTLLLVTHNRSDADALGCAVVPLLTFGQSFLDDACAET